MQLHERALSETLEVTSPEEVVEYVINWCRHEASKLRNEPTHAAEFEEANSIPAVEEATKLDALADRLDAAVEA